MASVGGFSGNLQGMHNRGGSNTCFIPLHTIGISDSVPCLIFSLRYPLSCQLRASPLSDAYSSFVPCIAVQTALDISCCNIANDHVSTQEHIVDHLYAVDDLQFGRGNCHLTAENQELKVIPRNQQFVSPDLPFLVIS